MFDSDKARLREILMDHYAVHRVELTAGMAKVWIAQMEPYPIEAIEGAFNAYMVSGTKPPLPSDIRKFLPDPFGHQGPEEAWNHAPKSESECGWVTNQIMAALAAAIDSVERGDMVAGRMAFIEAYKREIAQAQARGIAAQYWYTGGVGLSRDQKLSLKEKHTIEAAERRWISPVRAMNLLAELCVENGKAPDHHLARIQALTSTPLLLENPLPDVEADQKRIAEGVQAVGDRPPSAKEVAMEKIAEKLN